MLLLDEHTFRVAKAIKLNPIQKSVVDITSVEELKKFNLSKGDHIRIRFRLPAAELKSWPNIEQAIERLTAKQGIEVASVEPIMTLGPKAETYNIWGSPEKVMEMFAAAEGIEGDLLQVGLDLLK